MARFPWTVRHVLGALYAWSAAVLLGAVLLDVVYSHLLENVDASPVTPVYGGVSDLLLILAAISLLAALTATAASWDAPPARNLFAASSMLLVCELLAPIVLLPLSRTSAGSSVARIGPYVRLVPLVLASLLAFGAMRALPRDSSPPGPDGKALL